MEKKLRVAFLPSEESASKETDSIVEPVKKTEEFVGRSSVGSSTVPTMSVSKLEEKLAQKEDEIKRLQKLCLQYKSNTGSSGIGTFMALLIALVAFAIGFYAKLSQ
jgi:hypothetical protein